MNSFDGLIIEDVLNCPDDVALSGLQTRLFYAPDTYFYFVPIPEDDLTVDSNIVFKNDRSWSLLNVLIDESDLKSLFVNNIQRKKEKTELSVFINGFNTTNLNFIRKFKNRPLIFGVKDNSGTMWIIGNLRNRAFFENLEAGTGKKYDENAGFNIKISANTGIVGINPTNEYNKIFDFSFDESFE